MVIKAKRTIRVVKMSTPRMNIIINKISKSNNNKKNDTYFCERIKITTQRMDFDTYCLHVVFPPGKISISCVSNRFIKIASCWSAIGVAAVPPILTELSTGRVASIVLTRW